MLLRVQKTQIQDQPIANFSKQVALQQADSVFMRLLHDAYSLGKVLAARPGGNKVVFDASAGTNDLKLQFSRMIDKVKTGGGALANTIAWVGYDIASQIRALINYTGADAGYTDGRMGLSVNSQVIC